MRVNTHISFNGDCEAAFRFYAACLDARIEIMLTYGESPMAGQFPADWQGKIIHAGLAIGNDSISGADAWPADPGPPKGFTMSLSFNDTVETERVFNALAEGGKITLPLQKTFWTSHYGMLTDRFGIPWMINYNPSA